MTHIPNPTTSVIGCIRVSTAQQADAYGPERQRGEIEREAAREGLTVAGWVEESVSGADHDRAAENRYYALAREHHGLHFMFSHPNRVGRHVEIIVGIARQLHGLGATVWVAGLGNLRDTRNWRYFLRDAAEAESDYQNIVHQLISGKRGKAMQGRWPHGAPPWGYALARDERGRSTLPEPVPEQAEAVRRVFALADSMGQTRIAEAMTAEGWPVKFARADKPQRSIWTARMVSNILKNERYTGVAYFQGIRLEYEPIVPPEQFRRIAELRSRRKTQRGPRGRTELWSGHLRCPECGGAVSRDAATNEQKRRYTYYRCWRSKVPAARLAEGQGCGNNAAHRVDRVDEVWWAELVAMLTNPERLPELMPLPVRSSGGPPPVRVAELEAAIARAWEPFAAGKIGETVAERLAAPYVAELERLRAEYQPRAAAPAVDYVGFAADMAEALAGAGDTPSRRELLAALDVQLFVGREGVQRILVTPP